MEVASPDSRKDSNTILEYTAMTRIKLLKGDI